MKTYVIYKGYEYELLAGLTRREFDLRKITHNNEQYWISNGRGTPLLKPISELEYVREVSE